MGDNKLTRQLKKYFQQNADRIKIVFATKRELNNAILGTYQPQGTATVSSLNSLTKTASMNGYVYDCSTAGSLTNSDNTTVLVNAGDNAVLIWNNGAWYWDNFGGLVDLSGYVPTSRTIAGNALSSDISAQTLTDSLVYCNATTDLDYVMGGRII